jgi:hypothetical protein
MTTESAPALDLPPAPAPTPFIFEFFMVQGMGFRCMAYCDQAGCWRNALNNEELTGEIRILE